MTEDQLKRELDFLRQVIERQCPGKGFMLMVFDRENKVEKPCLNYVSNSRREDVLNVLKEWILKCGAAEDWMRDIV